MGMPTTHWPSLDDLPLNELYSPHKQLAIIPIGNQVIFIVKWVRLLGDTHDPPQNLLSQELMDSFRTFNHEG